MDLTQLDDHVLAGLLKQFFRDMPEPLYTFELFDEFVKLSEAGSRFLFVFAASYKLCVRAPQSIFEEDPSEPSST